MGAHAGGTGGGSQPLQSGNGTPVGAVTPTAKGYVYIDLTNGGLWQAVGATNTDWVAAGGIADALRNGDGTYGVGFSQFGDLLLLSQGTRDIQLVSADGMTNNGNAVSWGGADGTETLRVRTGTTGQHSGILQDANGDMTVPGTVNADAVTADAVNTDQITGASGDISLDNGVVITSAGIDLDASSGHFVMRAIEAGFFGATPVAKPTGVPVDAAGIHAALVSLGLIAA